MSANSKIEWTDHTFNPWIGCTKVSPGCANCYAEGESKRRGWAQWGKGKARHRTSASYWKQPLRWNRNAEILNSCWPNEVDRPRVFCASLADWLDDEVPIEWLADLLALIHATPNLDWLLLTKRPENFHKRLRAVMDIEESEDKVTEGILDGSGPGWALKTASWCGSIDGLKIEAPDNVWVGTSVEDQERADERIPKLLEIPARVRFLSCEPLLGPINLTKCKDDELGANWNVFEMGLHWVIVGGESGPKARPCNIEWIRSLVEQCKAAGVPEFVKQLGAKPYIESCPNCGHPESSHGVGRTVGCQHGDGSSENPICGCRKMRGELSHRMGDPYNFHPIRARKGGNPSEWPEDLRIRKFPC